jgi:hypothetical protein
MSITSEYSKPKNPISKTKATMNINDDAVSV